jgi:hypothetical protein
MTTRPKRRARRAEMAACDFGAISPLPEGPIAPRDREHHEGGAFREIPLFPELRPYLDELWELAEPGQTRVITRYDYNGRATNLRTQFQKIIRRAGVEPWLKPWQNLRSSRETELTEDFPLHVVTAWIGNTEAVAKRHYLQVTEDHFSKAAKSGAVAVQKAVQQPAASSGSESQETKQALAEQELVRSDAGMCDGVPYHLVGVTGFEPVTSAM